MKADSSPQKTDHSGISTQNGRLLKSITQSLAVVIIPTNRIAKSTKDSTFRLNTI